MQFYLNIWSLYRWTKVPRMATPLQQGRQGSTSTGRLLHSLRLEYHDCDGDDVLDPYCVAADKLSFGYIGPLHPPSQVVVSNGIVCYYLYLIMIICIYMYHNYLYSYIYIYTYLYSYIYIYIGYLIGMNAWWSVSVHDEWQLVIKSIVVWEYENSMTLRGCGGFVLSDYRGNDRA